MADANGKFPSGFITGTYIDFGSYDECLDLRVTSNNDLEDFKGQFCMMSVRSHLLSCIDKLTPDGRTYENAYGIPPEWIAVEMREMKSFYDKFGLYLGICTPSVCSQQELYNIINAIGKPVELKVTIQDCHTDESRRMPTYVKMVIVFLSTWLGLLLLGTALDIFERFNNKGQIEAHSESVGSKILKAFSLYTNAEILLDTRESDGPLGFLFGIRFILSQWVIIGHIFFFQDYWKYQRFSNSHRFYKLGTLPALISDSTPLTVDTFLTISGFLMVYNSSLKEVKLKVKESYVQKFLKKYIRLNFPIIFLILFTFVAPYIYNGPIWNTTLDHEVDKCYHHGWINLMFLQNIYSSEEMCWIHTWYISAAMEIQIVAYLIFALTKRHNKIGTAVGILVTFGCYASIGSLMYNNNVNTLSTYLLKSPDAIHKIVTSLYTKPFYHFPAFVVGMVTGYFAKKHPVPLPKVFQIFGWISFMVVLFYTIFSLWFKLPFGYLAIFVLVTRITLWSMCWGWFIFSCVTSKGILNKALSWKPFVLLGKISYSIFIYHLLLMTIRYASIRERMFMGIIPMVIDFFAFAVASIGFACITYIAIEIPCKALCEIWERKGSPIFTADTMSTKKDIHGTVKDRPDIENVSKKHI